MLKKLMAVVLVGLLTLGCMAVMPIAAEEPVTRLFLDFEDYTGDEKWQIGEDEKIQCWVPTGWGSYLGVERVSINTTETTYLTGTTEMPSNLGLGGKCLEIDNTEDGLGANAAIWTTVTLKPNTTYAISAWIKGYSVAEPADVYGKVVLGNPDATNPAPTQYLVQGVTPSSYRQDRVWHQIYNTYTTGDEAVTTRLWLRGYADAKVLYDNVAIYEIPAAEVNATYPSQITPAVPETILEDNNAVNNPYFFNGGFEHLPYYGTLGDSKATGWSVYGSMYDKLMYDADGNLIKNYAVVSAEKARTGQYSLKTETNIENPNTTRIYRTVTNLTPGKAYILSYYVYVTGSSAHGANISVRPESEWEEIRWYSGINAHLIPTEKTPTNDNWVPRKTCFIAPESGKVQIRISVGGSNGGTVDKPIYFDDFSLTEVPDAGMFDVAFYNDAGNEGDTPAESQNNVNIFVNGVNPSDTAQTYTLVYVTYSKEGEATQMQTVSLAQKELGAKYTNQYGNAAGNIDYIAPGFIQETIPVTVPAGQTLKVFVFDDLSKINAISVYTFE